MSRSGENRPAAIESSLFDRPAVTPDQRREAIRRIARQDARKSVASIRDALIEALEPARRERMTLKEKEPDCA